MNECCCGFNSCFLLKSFLLAIIMRVTFFATFKNLSARLHRPCRVLYPPASLQGWDCSFSHKVIPNMHLVYAEVSSYDISFNLY